MTVWQSKAQLDQIYGRDADNVLTNHRTKLVYPSGLSDMATIEYLSSLVGTEHVRSDLDEAGWNRAGERPPPRSPSTAVALLTPSVLRQMPVGDAVLLHGELPPAWVPRRVERGACQGRLAWSTPVGSTRFRRSTQPLGRAPKVGPAGRRASRTGGVTSFR